MGKEKIWLECVACGKKYASKEKRLRCECGNIFDVKYDYSQTGFDLKKARERKIGVWRYRELLPIDYSKGVVSLQEGGTPLYKCDKLAKKLGIKELFVKNEGANPTGSFKDRGMTVGVTLAVHTGQKRVGCASTGNTSASLAAYSARAGIPCVVLIPDKKIAFGKLAQALVYGAKVFGVAGNFDDTMAMVKELWDKNMLYLLNSMNCWRVEGQKTLGHEIIDQTGQVDRVVVPVGNAANISAIHKGILEMKKFGYAEKEPKMTGIQSAGAAPIVKMFKEKLEQLEAEKNPETIATAIRIGNPVSWKKAINAIRNSGGYAEKVSDKEIVEAQKLLAKTEGIFVEPASASSIAGLKKLLEQGIVDKDEKTVCVTTGNGLKDPNIVVENFKDAIIHVKTLKEVLEKI